jgi:fumarate reductase subunit C
MPQYRQFQPKPYEPRMSPFWYFDRWPYLKFMLRETSSVFVAYFAVIMLVQIAAINGGPISYVRFNAFMATPLMVCLNILAFLFVCLHAVTWFMLVPRVMMRQVLGRPTPDLMAAMPNFAIWLAASVFVAIFALRLI